MSAPDRREMLDRADKALSIRRQCALLCMARSGIYRAKRPANDNDLILMRRIDELFTAYPFYGSRRMTLQLRSEGHDINRKRVQRIMRTMGIVALGPKPNTSKPVPGHKIYPYLLRGLKIERPNHVWCADITYIPIGRGFLYLVAVMDWASRAVLSWRASNTVDDSFCVEALEEALAKYGKPEIFNTDQGRKAREFSPQSKADLSKACHSKEIPKSNVERFNGGWQLEMRLMWRQNFRNAICRIEGKAGDRIRSPEFLVQATRADLTSPVD
jgi:putative transposase